MQLRIFHSNYSNRMLTRYTEYRYSYTCSYNMHGRLSVENIAYNNTTEHIQFILYKNLTIEAPKFILYYRVTAILRA